MLSAVAFMRTQSGDHWPAMSSSVLSPAAAEAPAYIPLGPVPVPAVRAAIVLDYHAPRPAPAPLPFKTLALAVAIGATSAVGRKDRGQMIVDSVLHVSRKDDKGTPVTRAIPAGTLLDDVADDIKLTDDEIDEFIARRVIRVGTTEEIERAEQVKANRESAKVTQAGEATVAGLDARASAERQRIAADFDRQKAEALAKLDEQAAKERDDAQAKTTEQVQQRTAARSTARTSTAGAQSAARPMTPEARAQAAGGTPTPPVGASPDAGAESKTQKP